MTSVLNQTWEAQFLESFWGMVHAPYGDFGAIANLTRASSDPYSLQKILDFLSISSN